MRCGNAPRGASTASQWTSSDEPANWKRRIGWRHGTEKTGESLSLDTRLRKLEEEIDQFATPHVIDEAFLVLDLEKILELFGLGEFVEFLDLNLAQDRTGQAVGEGVFESMRFPPRAMLSSPDRPTACKRSDTTNSDGNDTREFGRTRSRS